MKYIKARLIDDCFENGMSVVFRESRRDLLIGTIESPFREDIEFVVNIRGIVTVIGDTINIVYAKYDDFRADFLIQ